MTDSFKARTTLKVGAQQYDILSLAALKSLNVERLPFSLKILLENLLRFEDGVNVTKADIEALLKWEPKALPSHEIAFTPARVIMQDFTGVPCIVDLAAMREAIVKLGGDPQKVNPLAPAELVIDHSVQVDEYGAANSLQHNNEIEFQRNGERYMFLRWGQTAFSNFKVVPPNTGIVHQVNIERLARVIFADEAGAKKTAYPDTLVGTDSHTTMVNGLGVLGWGVGGIEAEAAMLGQPVTMLIPQVIGFKLTGALPAGTTATDLVLTVTEILRKKGVVDKFVEFFGDGLKGLPLADRATIANMSPEFGSTCAIFPIDEETIRYLELTGRSAEQIALVEAYAKAQGLWRINGAPAADYTDVVELDLSTVEPSLAGPKRPQDRVPLHQSEERLSEQRQENGRGAHAEKPQGHRQRTGQGGRASFEVKDGAVLIAAITSCTNTSNPAVMVAAGLLARNALKQGLNVKPWVKTSLAPGSRVVTDYLVKAGLLQDLEALGFYTVGYGCTTCIGNSGPLKPEISEAVRVGDVVACSVLSGNRNFEGRVHPEIKMNFLASPPLVVAYALAGSLDIDITTEPLGTGKDGKPVYLKDIWPSAQDVAAAVGASVDSAMFKKGYANVFSGDANWAAIKTPGGKDLFLGWKIHLREEPALLRRHDHDAGAAGRHQGRARARGARRFGHHGSHFAGRQHLEIQPRRQIPDGAGRASRGFQFLWRAPRQSRSHDARHLRQYPPAQPAAARHRRRRHAAHPERRADVDLRRRDEIQGGQHAAGDSRRQGIRHRQLARLGGQGHDAVGREGGDRREFRAHSPLQFDRHGRAAAAVQGRPERAKLRAHRQGILRDRGTEPRRRENRQSHRQDRRRQNHRVRGAPAHRHAEGTRLLPARRDSAVRVAAARGAGQSGLGPLGPVNLTGL